MITAKSLYNYYKDHMDEFPLKFEMVDSNGIRALTKTGKYFGGVSFEFANPYPSYTIGRRWSYLSEKTEKLQLDHNLESEKGVLDAFMDCAYLDIADERNALNDVLKEFEESF